MGLDLSKFICPVRPPSYTRSLVKQPSALHLTVLTAVPSLH